MASSLSTLRTTSFVLWRSVALPPPTLVLSRVQPGSPLVVDELPPLTLRPVPGCTDLFVLAASECALEEGGLYYYWFEVSASQPGRPATRIRITDPFATAVDWRVLASRPPPPFTDDERYPAAVVRWTAGRLVTADLGDAPCPLLAAEPYPTNLPTNNRLVIYELPATWARANLTGARDMAVGTFRDTTALVDASVEGANFADLDLLSTGQQYLPDLGVNALELLPPADSIYPRQWGYGTTNYNAPDMELGFPATYAFPTANRDLAELVRTCHGKGIRFFADVVLAFSKCHPYRTAAWDDFFIDTSDPANATDPDTMNSRGTGKRDPFGASTIRYARLIEGYDPVSGSNQSLYPARQMMLSTLERWMVDFQVDGLRLDSVENVQNWDFIRDFKNYARSLHRARFPASATGDVDARFLAVGEELTEPLALLSDEGSGNPSRARLDGLWHESFKVYIRRALIGDKHDDEPTFEATVRKAIDCRSFGYLDMAQAVIYLGSHDVEGFRNERLVNYLWNCGVADAARRAKLGFACLLTAVGIPMILAGDEFADQHDLFDANGNVTQDGGKQVDPVNFGRTQDPWRADLRTYVSRLIRLRTNHPALAVNDTTFLHVDLSEGKRVLVWQRGDPLAGDLVVVVANFSDWGTADPWSPASTYDVPNWPALPPGRRWREIPQDRDVPASGGGPGAGHEPIFPWEAKVYATV